MIMKHTGWMLVGTIVALWFAEAAFAAECLLADDRMAVVDGNRTFILGLYENPKDDAVLDQAVGAGFNLVYASMDTAALDRLQAHGAWAWINTGGNIELNENAKKRGAALTKMVKQFAGHPALLAWEVPDEALWNCWYGAQQWREDEEPRQQAELINVLEDKALAATLRAQRDQISTCYAEANYAEGDALADAIWKQLGKEPPHPGYGLGDAPQRMAALCDGMRAGYAKLRALDTKHPVWMNHAPRNTMEQLAAFGTAADAVGCDIYPVPFSPRVGHSDLMDRSLASVGAYTVRMRDAAPGKAVWMVLQGFGWADIQEGLDDTAKKELRRPTLDETRFMAYDAIVHGARGLLYWGSAYIEKDSKLFEDLLTLARELKALQPVLSAPDAAVDLKVSYAQTHGSLDRGVVALPKQTGDTLCLIAVNEWTQPLRVTFSGLDAQNGTTYHCRVTGKEATVVNGAMTVSMRAQSVLALEPK